MADLDELTSTAPGVRQRGVGYPRLLPRLEGAKMAHQGVMQSFPDRKLDILDIVDGGDRAFVRTRVTGTNQGGFPAFNVPANATFPSRR